MSNVQNQTTVQVKSKIMSEVAPEVDKLMSEVKVDAKFLARLTGEMKRLCNIFDVENKTRLAVLKGLPEDAFYNLSFKVWKKVFKRHQGNLDLMWDYIEEFGEYKGVDYSHTPSKIWYQDFGVWAKQNGIYWY